MKELQKAAPILASLKMDETMDFYVNRLGFNAGWHDPNYGIVSRDRVTLHFWKTDDRIHPENTGCYLYVSGVDDWYEEMRAAGVVHPNGALADRPWGMREFAILDVHGNLLRIGQNLKT
jgi:catechol 2,3-dioxygenase-like lactoylglutathione lyase family enzyme